MPYSDPEMRRAAQRESYKRRYWSVKGMREREAKRKAEWFQIPDVKEHNRLKKRTERLRKKRDELARLVARAESIIAGAARKSAA